MNEYADIDVSLESSSFCVVDANGKILREVDKRLDANRRDKPHLVAKVLRESPPEMARRASRHRHNAWLLLTQNRLKLGARNHPVE